MEKIRNEFDYVLNYIKIVSHDGKEYNFYPQFVEFTYEESVFEPCAHGSVFVADSVDFATLLPIMGEERIKASFTRQDETSMEGNLLPAITFDMPVYTMVGKTQDAGSKKRQTYTLKYTSDELYKNISSKFYKKYKNQPYSSMIKSIFNDYLKIKKPLVISEQSRGDYSYLVQAKSPIAAINILKSRCISAEQNGYSFVFYEDRDQFNLISLGKLAKQNPIAAFTYEPKNISEDTQGLSHKPKRVATGLYAVERYEDSSGVDTLTGAMSGEGTSSLLSVDPIRRRYSLQAFDLRGEKSKLIHKIPLVENSSWEKFPHMNAGKPWIENSRMFSNPLTNLHMLITDFGQREQEYISQRDIEITPYDPELFVLQNRSQKMQFLKNLLYVTLSGDPRIKAGCVIEFFLPESLGKAGKMNPEEFDRYLQGKYLVVSVAHVLRKGSYRINLEIIKDSFFSNIVSRDPSKEYKFTY
jgi:hypothetical protein